MVDDLLRQLKHAPPAGLLDGLDDMVMTALAERRHDMVRTKRMTALAGFVSLGGGAFAGAIMGQPAAAAPTLSPFAPVNALAPSILLDTQ